MKRVKQTVALVTCLFATTAFAGESAHSDMSRAYIEGFLAGAQITDRVIINRLDEAYKKDQQSDFVQRAYKTRVGKRVSPVPATYYAGFCLPDDVVNDNVVKNILEAINTDSESNKAAEVFKTIQAKYPC